MKIHSIMRAIAITVTVAAVSLSANAATNVFQVRTPSGFQYFVNGVGDNPNLTLVRGFTYTFDVLTPGHPFYIKTAPGTGGTGAYVDDSITGINGTTSGMIVFAVAIDEPHDLLYYQCGVHAGMLGELHIIDPPEITITDFVPDTDVFLVSTGTDALNLNVQYTTNLVEGIWTDADITFNQYLNGTNSTFVTLPSGNPVFFRTLQGFF